MTQAKLTELVRFYGHKLDIHGQVGSEFSRGATVAYGIAKRMTEAIVIELLDKELTDNLKPDNDLEFE